MFHANNYSYPLDTWNFAPAYYPGSDYVDWFGLSVYGQQFKEEPNPDIPSLVDWPYKEMARLDPEKPIMIAEWATGDFPNSGNKGEWIREAFAVMKTKCPRVKAEVYWHERWQNLDQSYSNLHMRHAGELTHVCPEWFALADGLGNLQIDADIRIPKLAVARGLRWCRS